MKKHLFLFGLVLLVSVPTVVQAQAELVWESPAQLLLVGETASAQLFLEVQEDPINSVEGEVSFDPLLFAVDQIQTGGSALTFWIESPHLVAPGKIRFSGITPGGITQPKQFLFTLSFHTLQEGTLSLTFPVLTVLKNDGEGSVATVSTKPLLFQIQSPSSDQISGQESEISDNVPPEVFVPTLVRVPDLFAGASTLVFVAQDKQSGVQEYQIREGYLGSFVSVTSPYQIQDQSLHKKLFIRAIDGAGNVREVSFYSNTATRWYKFLFISGILGGIICLFLLWYAYRHKIFLRR